MISDEPSLSESFTQFVNSWLNGLSNEQGSFLVKRYGIDEAKQAAIAAEDLSAAALTLQGWFIDRLTVDPGVPGPFGDLAYNILSTAMESVDWLAVAEEVRASA